MLSSTPAIDRPSLVPGTGYLIAPRVPHGLATVVEGLTREVLRHRPEDIYVFAAHHFEKLLKLREEYHAEVYSDREFHHEFSRDFNLWPTKETRNIGRPSYSGWSLEKEIENFERREVPTDLETSQEDVSTDREHRKGSKQTCSRGPATTSKKTSKKSKDNGTTSDARATRIISQMSALHGSGKSIQTKDIKQELRRNKLSGEKSKATDSVEKGIRGERRSRTKLPKKDKDPEEEVEHATTTTSSSRTSAPRRPLKKVRRIETESETETERELAAKFGLENRHARPRVKNDGASRETIARTGSRERSSEAPLSEHSSERKVSSRALSMDRIRAYVLRKFASTASLEVLRSPTYVEQVQEVIDRAAPIIKEKLEEIGRSRGKRSRSVDLGWNGESLHRHAREERRHRDEGESGRRKSSNGLERKADIIKKEEAADSSGKDETILNAEREEKRLRRRRSAGSGRRSRRRGSGDFGVVDQVDDNSKHSNKLEHEFGVATRDTLEARLTATQSILENISKSASELSGARRSDPGENDPSESEVSDHTNVVSLPVVRPPSSRNSRSATKNGSDSLTLPPISPEAPKSTKKKDELSLPVLSAASNGNHSARRPQEQDISKDAEEASTMHDITSDIEDIAILPENEVAIVDAKQNSASERQGLTSELVNEEKRMRDEDVDGFLREDAAAAEVDEKRGSLEEFEELEEMEEGRRSVEVFRDSLNVTPEVADVPLRPDSLESDGGEIKHQDDNANPAGEGTFDKLKDKLIEIEMAERSIEKALACQQIVTCDTGEMTSQAEKSVTDGKINEAGEPTNEAEETLSEIRKSTGAGKIPINKGDEERERNSDDEKRKSTDDIDEIKGVTEISKDLNVGERLTKKAEKMESEIKGSTDETENLRNKVETSSNGIKKSTENESEKLKNEGKVLKNGVDQAVDQTEITTKATENAKKEDERSMGRTEKSSNEKLLNSVEESAVKFHVENVRSVNPKSSGKNSQIAEVAETDGDDTTTSEKKAENAAASGLSKGATSGNTAVTSECSNLPNGMRTRARKKRENDQLPMTAPLSLEVPYSYVLSEGSPCEIPDSVTTVIIPDRPCPSPVALEDEDYKLESTNQKEASYSNMSKEISKDERQEKNQRGMEVFGEYVRPEAALLPIDTDLVRGMKGMKPSQEIVIVHQDLDRIKEEGEEEEEKEDSERKEIEDHRQKKDDKETVKEEEEMKRLAMLEDIVEHEETEETGVKTIESKDAEKISSGVLDNEFLPDPKDLTVDTDSTNEGGADVAIEVRSVPENSSEENGSSQGTHTTTSSDAKESTVSNQSTESSGRPTVPELNLDSLQDNTVSSFKITANGTEKENNDSHRESDATSLIEPLTSDERLNRLVLIDNGDEIVTEELTERGLQSEAPEADQLYREEHAEYEWLGKDPLSTEISLEDEAKYQEDNIALSEDKYAVQTDPISQEKEEAEELGSEEEIAKELIDSLDKDMQFHAEKLDSKKDSEESVKSNLDIDDKSDRPLSVSVPSMSVEQERRDHEDKIDDVIRTEAVSELSNNVIDINQDNKDKKVAMINEETGQIELEAAEEAHIENSLVAPLAQFEQDELLGDNNKLEAADKEITIQNKPDIINEDTDIQEKPEERQTNVEEIPDSQNNDSKTEDRNEKSEEDEQKESQSQKKREQEKLEVHEECEQEKLETHEECKQEKLDVKEGIKEEIEQEELKIQGKSDEENVKVEEEITRVTVVPLEVTESREDSINESMKNDNGHEETKLNNESTPDDRAGKYAENEMEEKTEDLSEKVERVHGPITSAISEQSVEDRSRFGYWTTVTKSSTVETVIEAFDSNTNTDEKMEIVADAPEIIADESLIQKKDDFHSAVVKIQACIRGFLTRRRVRRNLKSEFISKNVPSTQETVTSARLMVPQDTSNLREARRLRREEALRNTTLSLENAFATGRLQHTGEFHDSVPLLPLDLTNCKTNSVTSNDTSDEEIDVEEVNPPDVTKSNVAESDPVRDNEPGASFRKGNAFVDPTFPIVMHLLTDTSRNCHFSVSQNSHSNFNASAGGAKHSMEPAVDILMLGYPRDDENQYLNFITSVEDLGSNMDSLTLDGMTKSTKNTDDIHRSTTSAEGSLREPLALAGVPQGVVIEEITSLDDLVPSESTKPSTAPKTSLDTNSTMPSEECALEDVKDDLGMSPRTTNAVAEDRKQGVEGRESDCNSGGVGENDSRSENVNDRSDEISRDNREHMEEEKDDKA